MKTKSFKSGADWIQDITLTSGTYTLVMYVKNMHGEVCTFSLYNGSEWEPFEVYSERGKWSKVYTTFTIEEPKTRLNLISSGYTSAEPVYVCLPQLTKGTIPAEPGASPLDVTQSISDIKAQMAEMQKGVESVTASVDKLKESVDISFADGIIDQAEAKAIEKYINIVTTEKASLEATYNKLFTNSYLSGEPKRALLNAKVSYFGAVENLLQSINRAITDGKATKDEKADVDRRYSDYKDALATLRGALETANKAVQKAIEDGVKEYTDDAVTELGKHPPRINSISKNWEVWQIIDGVGRYVDTGDTSVGDDGKAPKIVDGYWYIWDGTKYVSSGIKATGPKGDPGKDADMAVVNQLKSDLGDANKLIKTLQTITDGLKEGKLNKEEYEDLTWLTKAISDGKTQVAGGLILSRVLALSNELDEIKSYLSGDDKNNPYAFRAGVKDFGQKNENANISIKHDGSAQFGGMHVDPEGAISFVEKYESGLYKSIVTLNKNGAAFKFYDDMEVHGGQWKSYPNFFINNEYIGGEGLLDFESSHLNIRSINVRDNIDFSGAVLCGGRVDSRGIVQTSFGKYKNENGRSDPKVSYNYGEKTFTVYHSIGSANYVPFITPLDASNAVMPAILDVSAYSFKVAFYNRHGANYQCGFNYLCHKGD